MSETNADRSAKTATLKDMYIASSVNFFDLPKEDTQFGIEKSESNKLKTCDKLIVHYTRLNLKQIYGSKKDKIERNIENVKKLGKFLEAFYNSDNDEEKDKTETYQQFLERYAISKTQLVLNQRARLEALRLENADIEKQISSIETTASAKQMDVEALNRLQAIVKAQFAALGLNPDGSKMEPVAEQEPIAEQDEELAS
jgi:hypothetical protein